MLAGTTLATALVPQHWATTLVCAVGALTGLRELCAGATLWVWWGAVNGSGATAGGLGAGGLGAGIGAGIGAAVALIAFGVLARAVGEAVGEAVGGNASSANPTPRLRFPGWCVPALLGGVLAVRQRAVAGELTAAPSVVPEVIVLGLLASAVLSLAPRSSTPGIAHRSVNAGRQSGWGPAGRIALGGVALVGALRFAQLWTAETQNQLALAAPLHAQRLVLASALRATSGPPDRARRLALEWMRAVPDSDAAAARVGWEMALNLGWRPQRPQSDVVDIAAALDERGRGGEALRLLARYPRTGVIDFWRAVYERVQGGEDGWRGGMDDVPVLGPAGLRLDWSMLHNEDRSAVFRMVEPARVSLRAHMQSFEGEPTVEVRLDAARSTWIPAGELDLGVLLPGPHTLNVRYQTDLEGPTGDRNVWVTRLQIAPK